MKYKMAIIGYGGMGKYHHKMLKDTNDNIDVISAYDIRDEIKIEINKNGLKSYENPEELYKDKFIDLVLIATPNDSHKDYAINCMRSCKNVICEKPATLNLKEIEEIYKVSKETNRFFTVHQNRREDSDYLTIKKILSDKILEKPYIIESRVQGSRQSLYGWRGYKINGGGMVYDWGVHLIDQMLNLLPEKIVSINANLHSVFAKEVDDAFIATFTFESGINYLINIDMNCFILQPRWHMSSKDGTAIIENWELDGKIVKLLDKSEVKWSENIVYTAAGPTRSMAPRPKETTRDIDLPKVFGDSALYYKNIVDVLNKNAELNIKEEEVIRIMKVIDAIFESNKNKKSIKCNI